MARLQVEVVARAIKVGRHHSDIVGAILQVEALAHLQPGDLGDGVGLVGVLQRRGQQARLADGLRSLARIDARAAQKQQLLHAVPPALADHVLLDLQVLVDEVGAVFQVGHDAAHMGCSKHHILGLLTVKELAHGHAVHQVKLAVRAAHQVGVAFLFQVVPDGRAHQTTVPGHIYLAVFLHLFS